MRNQLFATVIVLAGAGSASAVTPYAEIKAEAARQWPHDYSMQQYTVDRQVKAYKAMATFQARDVPVDILHRVLSDARLNWPDDYAQQEYTVNHQLAAYRHLHSGHYAHIPEDIRAKAADQWPSDYNMQEYTIKQQYKAYLKLQE